MLHFDAVLQRSRRKVQEKCALGMICGADFLKAVQTILFGNECMRERRILTQASRPYPASQPSSCPNPPGGGLCRAEPADTWPPAEYG